MAGLNSAQVRTELEVMGKGYLATSVAIKAHTLALAKTGEEYAKSIAPVGTKTHVLKSGYVDKPGAYRDSIEGTVVFKNGRWIGRVIARDYKAHWIEFGTRKWPKLSVIRRARSFVGGRSE